MKGFHLDCGPVATGRDKANDMSIPDSRIVEKPAKFTQRIGDDSSQGDDHEEQYLWGTSGFGAGYRCAI
jgi:hypothetical protein